MLFANLSVFNNESCNFTFMLTFFTKKKKKTINFCYWFGHFRFFSECLQELQLHLGVLQQHAALIGGPNATSCPICHKLFLGADALMEHMKHSHKEPTNNTSATTASKYQLRERLTATLFIFCIISWIKSISLPTVIFVPKSHWKRKKIIEKCGLKMMTSIWLIFYFFFWYKHLK